MSATQDSIAILFSEHHDAVLGFLRSRAPQHAEDLLSEVFAVAVRRSDAIPVGAERAWLFGVAKNVLRDHQRAQRRASALLDELEAHAVSSAPGPEPAVIGAAMNALPQTERAVLALTGLEGLSSAEAAERLGMSAGSTRNAMVRARKNLAVQLVGFGLLATLALVAVVIGRRDRAGERTAPQLASTLAKQLASAGTVSAVAEASDPTGSGRYSLRVDRRAGRQAFGLGAGVVGRGPLRGTLDYSGPAGTPRARVDAVVRRSERVVAAMRTITEGQVAALIADGAAGRARMLTVGSGASQRSTVEGTVVGFGGQRLQLRVAFGGAPATLRRVQARPAGTGTSWTTLEVGRWRLAAPVASAPSSPAPTPSTTPAPTPTPRPAPTSTPRTRSTVTPVQAAKNRALVASTPRYSGSTGAVRYSETRTRMSGSKGYDVTKSWREIGGGHRSYERTVTYDAQGRAKGGREVWWSDSMWVMASLTQSGERLMPSVAVTCPVAPPAGQSDERFMSFDADDFWDPANAEHLTPGRPLRGRPTLRGVRTGDPGFTYKLWFDARTKEPMRVRVRMAALGRSKAMDQVTDILAWRKRQAGGSSARLDPNLPAKFRLADLRKDCSSAPTGAPVATTPPTGAPVATTPPTGAPVATTPVETPAPTG